MIECRDLTKKYNDLFAVDRLTLKLDRGDVYGFIGPNGSGKTTTMRMLATLLNPSWGEATVCGHSIYTGSKEIRRSIGYMPDFFGVYDDMKVTEYLEFFAAAYRITGADRRKKVDQVLDLVDLGYKRDALVTSLSRRMTQRRRALFAGLAARHAAGRGPPPRAPPGAAGAPARRAGQRPRPAGADRDA